MKVTQEKLPASQIGLEIEIPSEMSKQAYEKVVQEFSRTANIPGFRKGKVPRQILVQRLGVQRIKAATLDELIQKGLTQALEQESIEALGNYQLISPMEQLVNEYKPGEAFTFSASVDVAPEVKLGDYINLKVQVEEIPYDSTNVDKFLSERRDEKATLIPVEVRPAQKGDVAVVDYRGRFVPSSQEDDEPTEISGAQATNFEIELGEGKFLDDIVNGIIGMTPGETKEVTMEFPQDYPRKDLASKQAAFTVTLKDLKEKELPELTDDFAQEVSEFDTMAELQSSLESKFREKTQQETLAKEKVALIEELLNHVEIELPESMIKQEVESIMRQNIIQLQQSGIDVGKMLNENLVQQLVERTRPEAINRLKQSLALEEIAKAQSLEVEPETLDDKVEEVITQLSEQEVDVNKLRELVAIDLLIEKAIDWLVEHATIELIPPESLNAAVAPPEAPVE